VHEKLYQSEDLSEISFDVYIEELLKVMRRFVRGDKEIEVETDLDPVTLTVNQAIPCGLWFNEIVTNAYKHAFNEQDSGKIRIEFKDLGKQLMFRVSDDGIGLPENVEDLMKSSLGMRLIRTLSKQLNADFRTSNHTGSSFEIIFNKEPGLMG
jgi:two-component sensor histidine kinase